MLKKYPGITVVVETCCTDDVDNDILLPIV